MNYNDEITKCQSLPELVQLVNDLNGRLDAVKTEITLYKIAIACCHADIIAKHGNRAFNRLARQDTDIYPFVMLFSVIADMYGSLADRYFSPGHTGWRYNGREIGQIFYYDGTPLTVSYSYKGILSQLGKMYVNGEISRQECRELFKWAIDASKELTSAGIIAYIKSITKNARANSNATTKGTRDNDKFRSGTIGVL